MGRTEGAEKVKQVKSKSINATKVVIQPKTKKDHCKEWSETRIRGLKPETHQTETEKKSFFLTLWSSWSWAQPVRDDKHLSYGSSHSLEIPLVVLGGQGQKHPLYASSSTLDCVHAATSCKLSRCCFINSACSSFIMSSIVNKQTNKQTILLAQWRSSVTSALVSKWGPQQESESCCHLLLFTSALHRLLLLLLTPPSSAGITAKLQLFLPNTHAHLRICMYLSFMQTQSARCTEATKQINCNISPALHLDQPTHNICITVEASWNSDEISWSDFRWPDFQRIRLAVQTVYDTLLSPAKLNTWTNAKSPSCHLCGRRETLEHLLSSYSKLLADWRYRSHIQDRCSQIRLNMVIYSTTWASWSLQKVSNYQELAVVGHQSQQSFPCWPKLYQNDWLTF